MLDPKYLRDHAEAVEKELAKRGAAFPLNTFIAADEERRLRIAELEELKARQNRASEAIARAKREQQPITDILAAMKQIAEQTAELRAAERLSEEKWRQELLALPNIPHPSVPVGREPSENKEVRRWGEPRQFPFPVRSHDELGEALGILDFARAAKIAGARFALYKGAGALLERALINFMLDVAAERGYREVLPPFLVNRDAMIGTGQLPKFEGDLFRTADPEYFLIPTAEVPLTNIHAGEILEERDLPIRYSAYTPCFRREAGSYGKDVKGLIRQHQFNKVELVSFSTPERSYDELEQLTSDAEEVLRRLELPYRVVVLCTGDLGFAAAKTYDLEVWLPSQETYREISSCSNFEAFQARRAEIRFRGSDKKVRHLHTLNGSGLAVGRTVVAILENFQREDGTVETPNVLRPYMKGMAWIARES